MILKIPDPHPFSNLYVSYIHFWCHCNVVDWHPIALLIYHFTYFQPEDIPVFSILFCKYKCTTWKSGEPHPFNIVCFHPLYQFTLFSGKMWTPTLLQYFKISNLRPLKCVDCPLCRSKSLFCVACVNTTHNQAAHILFQLKEYSVILTTSFYDMKLKIFYIYKLCMIMCIGIAPTIDHCIQNIALTS